MKKYRPRLLFFGELPSGSVHGISIANHINIEILKSAFSIDIVEDTVPLEQHGIIAVPKIKNFFRNNIRIAIKAICNRYKYLYLVYSMSLLGSVKCFSAIVMFSVFSRGKVILHIHRGDFFTKFYTRRFNRFITRLVFRLSDRIIVLSNIQKEEFRAISRRPVHVLRNTIEYEHPANLLPRGGSRFIFLSNYLIDKGILDLLEVFSKLIKRYESIRLVTYGEYSDKKLKKLMQSFSSSAIVVDGPISGKNKFEVISESDCLILPSWNEGQPMVIIEAMSVGTPVIASAVGLIPELLGADYPLLTIAGDKESLKEKIVQFIEYPHKTILSNYLYNRYKDFYTPGIHSNILMNIFS